MGAVLRQLMSAYTQNPDAYQDIALWQDTEARTRVSVWVPMMDYQEFKKTLQKNGLSVTDALKGMLLSLKNLKEN
jgi:hypothetical protein